MPHLNEINQKYSSRGLKIVAVSNEQADIIEKKGVQGLGMNYGVARASGASGLYGVNGIPDSFIVGKDGRILWRGHPGYINDEMLAAWLGGQPLPEGAPASSAGGGGISSMFLKLGIFILLSGVAIFFVLRMLKPRTANAPVYPMQAWQQPQGNPPAVQAPQGGSPPPAPSNNCSHCGAPKREGRKSCMGCGAPF